MSNLQRRIGKRARQAPPPAIQTDTVPAAVGGWNARDNIANMDRAFALDMVNYFPQGQSIDLRKGSETWATGFPGPVETLHEYVRGPSRWLLAAAGTGIYDASGAGPIGAPLGTGYANARWVAINAGAQGGERALLANGFDPVQSFDGATLGDAGFTGPTNPISHLGLSKKRVWAVEQDTGRAWFGPPEAVSGPLSPFDIGSVVPRGGNLRAVGNLTRDGGEGMDDLTVFVMENGHIVLYRGIDPGDAANWALAGVWLGGQPIGNQPFVDYGSDLLVITEAGFISCLRYTQQAATLDLSRISDNIRNAVNDAAQSFRALHGWRGIFDPLNRQLIFNIPQVQGQVAHQYVMNSLTGAWAQFRNWNAFSWSHFGDRIYYGGPDRIVQANEGRADEAQAIFGRWQSAWDYFGSPGREKHFTQYRPNIRAGRSISLSLGIGTDFDQPTAIPAVATQETEGGLWGEAIWGVSNWAGSDVVTREWRGAGDSGYNASVVYETISRGARLSFLSTDFAYTMGGAI